MSNFFGCNMCGMEYEGIPAVSLQLPAESICTDLCRDCYEKLKSEAGAAIGNNGEIPRILAEVLAITLAETLAPSGTAEDQPEFSISGVVDDPIDSDADFSNQASSKESSASIIRLPEGMIAENDDSVFPEIKEAE